ncbi:hypothetical protein COCCADRAFT_30261 [Bipolaris zeicola 26-R-13]|uniref:Uncharacterized protein n=1 Tax=Cochliobolus carbonum (strain 26-R-13) TaxID=930089 RepID=W6XS80_COCC2|nr:uncharacterized protein COCCADRAFT_30261 [Bipolaris zeicola 26-R-13]EUC28498.1 hypothetical protein COCCADRAFT_30261 [Bipolaris zeicola 26-R-13]
MAPTPNTSNIPDAPPALSSNTPSRSDGFSPGAIIGIVIAIVFLILTVPLIAVCLRRYEKSRLRETPKSPSSSTASLRSVQEDHSLKSILVTKELSRSSVRMERADERVRRPEEMYGGGRERERAWSCTEVHGGEK